MLDAGTFKMRQGILELIAGITLSKVEGASGIGVRNDHPEDLKKRKNLSKGIKADVDDGRVALELNVNLDYGRDFHEVGRRIQREVKGAVESMTGWAVDVVDVNVVGVNALQVNDSRSFSKRTLARKLACDLLYQMDITGDDLENVSGRYHRMLVDGLEESGIPAGEIPDFSLELVQFFLNNHEDIDKLITSYADRWSLERMPIVDRNLLRLGFAELLYKEDIPTKVTINEYLELAKAFSTGDSYKFINGVMGKLVKDKHLNDSKQAEDQC